MTCYATGADFQSRENGEAAATLPDGVPADNTNT